MVNFEKSDRIGTTLAQYNLQRSFNHLHTGPTKIMTFNTQMLCGGNPTIKLLDR